MSMASISQPPPPPQCFYGRSGLILLSSSLFTLSFPRGKTAASLELLVRALRTESVRGRIGSPESYGSDLLRRPGISTEKDLGGSSDEEDSGDEREAKDWVDWDDRILEDTVPLVGFVRMILHSGKYGSGHRLSPEHERTIVERLLPYHPEFEKKIGCGIDYISVGHHPDFESSRCLFIARKDGEIVDFSYWKCIKGLIRKSYPLHADSFILRHFFRRRQNR